MEEGRARALKAWLGAALLVAAGCVPIPPELLPVAHNPSGAAVKEIKDPGPPTLTAAGARFVAKASDPARLADFLVLAEKDYGRVMTDTGLYSFQPEGLYPVFLYRDADEYLAKTGAPGWSGGIAVGNAIYTFDGPQMPRTLAHEITHLVFHEYMGDAGRLLWFNEGLAVYEELQAASPADKPTMEAWLASSHQAPMSFADMVGYRPGDARTRQWYGQSASMARFLVEVGGRSNVERFLTLTKDGASLDGALAQSFPTLCDGLASLEARWRLTKA